MADSIIDLEDNSKFRVALDLAYEIAKAEEKAEVGAERGREYWLRLYAQCRSVVIDGWSAEDAMSEDADEA